MEREIGGLLRTEAVLDAHVLNARGKLQHRKQHVADLLLLILAYER